LRGKDLAQATAFTYASLGRESVAAEIGKKIISRQREKSRFCEIQEKENSRVLLISLAASCLKGKERFASTEWKGGNYREGGAVRSPRKGGASQLYTGEKSSPDVREIEKSRKKGGAAPASGGKKKE